MLCHLLPSAKVGQRTQSCPLTSCVMPECVRTFPLLHIADTRPKHSRCPSPVKKNAVLIQLIGHNSQVCPYLLDQSTDKDEGR